jgi:hypothetical protein
LPDATMALAVPVTAAACTDTPSRTAASVAVAAIAAMNRRGPTAFWACEDPRRWGRDRDESVARMSGAKVGLVFDEPGTCCPGFGRGSNIVDSERLKSPQWVGYGPPAVPLGVPCPRSSPAVPGAPRRPRISRSPGVPAVPVLLPASPMPGAPRVPRGPALRRFVGFRRLPHPTWGRLGPWKPQFGPNSILTSVIVECSPRLRKPRSAAGSGGTNRLGIRRTRVGDQGRFGGTKW